MIEFLFYASQWLLVITFFGVFVLLCVWMWTLIRAKVPFVPVPNSILKDIRSHVNIQDTSVVYDLRCGDARVLLDLARSNKNATYIGIENSPFPVLLARFGSWWHRMRYDTRVYIRNQDFFNVDVSDATHIFTYLYPNVMDDLLPKLERELKPGSRLMSVAFKFTQKQPIAEIDLGRKKYQLARKIYLYEF